MNDLIFTQIYQDFYRDLSILSSSVHFLSPQREAEKVGAVIILSLAKTALEFHTGITKLGHKLLNNQMVQDLF